jgi:hypothetical protein
VLDLELAPVGDFDEEIIEARRYNTVCCLSRIGGVPHDLSFWDVSQDAGIALHELRDQLRTGSMTTDWPSPEPPRPATAELSMTVVICTRDRPAGLRAALRSLHGQLDSSFTVLVVDNSSNSSAAPVVDELGLPTWEYTVEPRPGLARAEPAAVCGMMLPAELEVEAQVRFEQYGGFNKGRGTRPEVLRMGTSVASPLYPLPPFGPGGNMAFRTASLRAVGGFDPYLGAGTRSHTGEETRVLSLLLMDGQVVLHWPQAITWHTHRREMAALRQQLYGCGAGLSAFYASMIRSKPSLIFDILRLCPYAVRDLRHSAKSLQLGQLPDDYPVSLLKAVRRGLVEGGLMYAREAIADRRWRPQMRPLRGPAEVVPQTTGHYRRAELSREPEHN